MEFKLGEHPIPKELIFCRKTFFFCMIPIYQLLKGHVLLVPRRRVASFAQLETAEMFELALVTRLVTMTVEKGYSADSSTVALREGGALAHAVVHILPRVKGDFKDNDEVYRQLNTFDSAFSEEYNRELALGNMYSQKTINAIN
jgi:bis(5'-adenosyl)-triphosphatase